MSKDLNRRRFLHQSALATSATALTFRFEEKALRAQQEQPAGPNAALNATVGFPQGRLGKLSVSRLIAGGNLISGFAHSRDLVYVSSLVKQYFTDDKSIETLQRCEAQGINTAILRVDDQILRILKGYWKERGGKMQWIAYKVLGAGAIHPQEGFQYAYQHGADFICVGMFDFQVDQDVALARSAFAGAQQRERPWCA